MTNTTQNNLRADSEMTFLSQPDVVLADRFLATFRARDSLEPESKLILAVLEEAIQCFQKYHLAGGRGNRALFCEAENWIMEENSEWPFSFENCCLAVGLSPGYVRRGLLRWKQQKMARCKDRKTPTICQQSRYAKHYHGRPKGIGAKSVYQGKRTIQLGKGVCQ